MTINERVSPKRLAEIIARAEVCDDSVLTDYRDIESIARELQQCRAAAEKPVACIDRANLDYFDSGAGADVWPASESDSDDVLLYAAPQLPQPAPVAVPDEMEMDDEFDSAFEHGKAVGWNACRAAMLHGKAELPAYEIKRFGQFSVIPHSGGIDNLVTSIQWFHFERGTIPEKAYNQSIVEKYALQAIINALQHKCDGMDDAPIPVIWPAPQQEVK